MKPILEVQHVAKKFSLGSRVGYLSLRERLATRWWNDSQEREDFWALNDVSFDVHQGDSIGIIGRNGAGKSTLLKVLSRITPPTKGRIVARGRIASLLEVGTGFHPELTGRENIFFNGSLLGMRRNEIQSKFDSIVDFSGVEKFLDTQLKHYSSGMQLRLAFSVAAFLEPEVMVIDEVLAVGDAEFQKKCLGKMEEVSKSGRTILFVSHNMSAIQTLCSKAVYLHQGEVRLLGNSFETAEVYFNDVGVSDDGTNGVYNFQDLQNIIQKVEVFCEDRLSSILHMGCMLRLKVHFKHSYPLDFPVLGVIIKDRNNVPILAINNKHYHGNVVTTSVESGAIQLLIPSLPLFAGIYHVDVHFGDRFKDIQVLRDRVTLHVEPASFSAGELPDANFNRIFIKEAEWSFEK